MPAYWSKSLAHHVEVTSGEVLKTLADGRSFALTQPEKNEWQNAAGKLLLAAETGNAREVEAATTALENALFIDGMRLKLWPFAEGTQKGAIA